MTYTPETPAVVQVSVSGPDRAGNSYLWLGTSQATLNPDQAKRVAKELGGESAVTGEITAQIDGDGTLRLFQDRVARVVLEKSVDAAFEADTQFSAKLEDGVLHLIFPGKGRVRADGAELEEIRRVLRGDFAEELRIVTVGEYVDLYQDNDFISLDEAEQERVRDFLSPAVAVSAAEEPAREPGTLAGDFATELLALASRYPGLFPDVSATDPFYLEVITKGMSYVVSQDRAKAGI
jgi:hypothetical protein